MEGNVTLDLDELRHTNDDGVTVVRVALRGTLYFRRSHEPAQREAIKRCVREFVGRSRGALRWLFPTPAGARELGGDAVAPSVEAKLAELDATDDAWELHVHGGAAAEEASDLGVQVFVRRDWEEAPPHNHLSFLSFRFPMLWFRDVRPGFPSYVLECARALAATHGYGGVGVVTAADRFLGVPFEPVVASLAERFPGIEIDYPAKHLVWVRAGIKGVNWLTVVGDEWLAKVGGLEALRTALPPAVVLHPYPGGCMIQAGEVPQTGDRNRRLDAPEYRRVAAALRAIRITTHSGVHSGEGLDRPRFERWLRRFDDE